MSNRSMLEFNHDFCPQLEGGNARLVGWAEKIVNYLRSGDPVHLPEGVTFFHRRHHSEPCPLGEPPRGWDNRRPENYARTFNPAALSTTAEGYLDVLVPGDGTAPADPIECRNERAARVAKEINRLRERVKELEIQSGVRIREIDPRGARELGKR